MYRCVVSLFLLPCVLLFQSAALGHCHDVSGRARAPHNHTCAIFSQIPTQHGHHNSSPGGHHNHDDGDDLPEPDTQPTPQREPLSDHDSDAVYLGTADAVVVERFKVRDEVTHSTLWIPAASALLAASWDGPRSQAVKCGYPPLPSSLFPLYIRHLAILI